MDLVGINIWAVLVAALAKFAVGALWYSPYLFGKVWMREAKLTPEQCADPLKPIILSAILALIVAFTMAVVIELTGVGLFEALALAVVIAIGLVCALFAPAFAFEGRSFRLYMIYACQYLVELVVMAAIIGAWR